MSLVHEKLYQSRDLAKIDFAQYLRELVENLAAAHGEKAHGIALTVHAENILLGIDTAIPCGLIVNELVSNAFKHGFRSGEPGVLSVDMSRQAGGLSLVVHNTGQELPPGIDFRRTTSLGMKLVLTLVHQLRGELTWENGDGVTFRLRVSEARERSSQAAARPPQQ
jgi:two-component sensor histidine kinase